MINIYIIQSYSAVIMCFFSKSIRPSKKKVQNPKKTHRGTAVCGKFQIRGPYKVPRFLEAALNHAVGKRGAKSQNGCIFPKEGRGENTS